MGRLRAALKIMRMNEITNSLGLERVREEWSNRALNVRGQSFSLSLRRTDMNTENRILSEGSENLTQKCVSRVHRCF